MQYDGENRMISYTNSGVTTAYSYDGDGRRVKRVVGSGGPSPVTTVFVYNAGGQLVAEYTDSTSPPPGPGGTSYLTTDYLGSTRVVTGPLSGGSVAVRARYDYLPFGEELASGTGGRTVGMGYGGADGTRQKFTQKERDPESELDYFLARYYSSAQGRFTSADGVFNDSDPAVPQSWNKYAYVRNNPLRYIDPTGEKADVSINTDEENKTGKVAIKASIAIYSDQDKPLTDLQLADAANKIKAQIESAWSGSFERDGITYTVSTEVTVTVHGSEQEALDFGAQNVIAVKNGEAIPGQRDSNVNERGLSSSSAPDTGTWNYQSFSSRGSPRHEFGHLLGVGHHIGGGSIMNTLAATMPARATGEDLSRAVGGEVDSVRMASRPLVPRSDYQEVRGGGRRFEYGKPRSSGGRREVRAARYWGVFGK
jgi:RHS repeat-associated protein